MHLLLRIQNNISLLAAWPPTRLLAIACGVLLLSTALTGLWVYNTFEASQFPVTILEDQLSFSGKKLKSHYDKIGDTLHIYKRAQIFDFAFMASYSLLGFFGWTLLARLHGEDGIFHDWGYVAALIIPLAAIMDVLENVTSLVMLSDSKNFPNWLGVVYSSFASVKWVLIIVGGLWAVVSAIMLIAPIRKILLK